MRVTEFKPQFNRFFCLFVLIFLNLYPVAVLVAFLPRSTFVMFYGTVSFLTAGQVE